MGSIAEISPCIPVMAGADVDEEFELTDDPPPPPQLIKIKLIKIKIIFIEFPQKYSPTIGIYELNNNKNKKSLPKKAFFGLSYF